MHTEKNTDLPSSEGRLELLYRTAQAFNSSTNIVEIFDRIIDEVLVALRAERGYLVSRQSDGELSFHVAQGADGEMLDPEKMEVSSSIIQQAIDQKEPLLSVDALQDARFTDSASVLELQLKSILCVPLACKSGFQGVIYVENRGQEGIFTHQELELLSAIAANAAVAIDNAQHYLDLQNELQKVNLLYEISADLNAQLDLQELLMATLQRVQSALAAPTASILTVEDDCLVFQVALGDMAEQLKPYKIPIDASISGWVVRNKQGIIVNNVEKDARFNQFYDHASGFVTRSMLAAPLQVKEQAFGVISLINKPGGFRAKDLDLLTAIAATASIAVENARLYQAAVDEGRIEQELKMALDVQTGLLPDQIPQPPGWDLAAHWQPAHQVSGDFYDFIELTSAGHKLFNREGHLGMLIADVTDKGMPAALFMAFTRSIIRASLYQADSPAQGITQANHLTCQESKRGLFVTLFYSQLSPGSGEITYVNAGHNPPLLYHAATGSLKRLQSTGIPLGIDQSFTYQQNRFSMEAGDILIAYTDGVTEAANTENEEFGVARLEQIILANKDGAADDIATAVERAVNDFNPAGKQFDDITIMVIKRMHDVNQTMFSKMD
jgi:serine phosphatase RsbU (regulator of sigma subunit)